MTASLKNSRPKGMPKTGAVPPAASVSRFSTSTRPGGVGMLIKSPRQVAMNSTKASFLHDAARRSAAVAPELMAKQPTLAGSAHS